jgi:hypothetical protein
MFNKQKHHEHQYFTFKKYPRPVSIDPAIKTLINGYETQAEQIRDLIIDNARFQSDLAAIHAYYRDELCCDCCHADVCSKRESIKFGDDCEDKPLPCSPEIEIEEIDEPEVSDEYREIIEEQIKLLRETNQELANFSKVDNTDRIRDNAREIANLLWVIAERKSPCANTD